MKLLNKIFIYGVSGSGKTSLSIELQKKLGCVLIEADYLRKAVAQKEKTQAEDPFVYIGTKEAYRYFGEFNEENIIKGLGAVRNSMAPYVAKEIEKYHDSLIMESAFLDPNLLSGIGKLILIITTNENKHRSQYFKYREQNESNIETFQVTRIIQNYLLQEAKSLPVKVIENNFEVESLVDII